MLPPPKEGAVLPDITDDDYLNPPDTEDELLMSSSAYRDDPLSAETELDEGDDESDEDQDDEDEE